METSKAKRKKADEAPTKYSGIAIEKEISKLDEAGNTILNTPKAEAFIFFWSKRLNNLNQEVKINPEVSAAHNEIQVLEVKLHHVTKLKGRFRLQPDRISQKQKGRDSKSKEKNPNQHLHCFTGLENLNAGYSKELKKQENLSARREWEIRP